MIPSITHPQAIYIGPSIALELLSLLEDPGPRALPGIARPRFCDVGQVDLLLRLFDDGVG